MAAPVLDIALKESEFVRNCSVESGGLKYKSAAGLCIDKPDLNIHLDKCVLTKLVCIDGYIKNSTVRESITATGSLFLVDCLTIGSIVAGGNVYLIRCPKTGSIEAEGVVHVLAAKVKAFVDGGLSSSEGEEEDGE
jgi:hypothetical protein